MKFQVQARLRTATHSCHVRINQHPMLVGLTDHEFPLSTYLTILLAYFHLFERIETQITQFEKNNSLPFKYSARSNWLQDDLRFFQLDPNLPSNRPTRPIDIPLIENIGQFIGMLYPIEGSALGGQVISQHLQKNHDLTQNYGAKFFNGYAENTAIKWNEFCRFTDVIKKNEHECNNAEVTAALLFSKFEDVLNDYQPSNRA